MKKPTKRRFASVWDAIEETREDAELMKLRARLMMALQDRISHQNVSEAQTARALGVTQPRLSNLMRGRITLFPVESLVGMLTRLGMRVEVKVREVT